MVLKVQGKYFEQDENHVDLTSAAIKIAWKAKVQTRGLEGPVGPGCQLGHLNDSKIFWKKIMRQKNKNKENNGFQSFASPANRQRNKSIKNKVRKT